MIYLDTNILIYAFCKNVDNEEQKTIAQGILKSAISEEKLLLSELTMYEFAFVSQKLKESGEATRLNLDFLSQYVKNANIHKKVIDTMQKTSSYKHSFDTYHVCFANHFNCSEIVTYDSGFKIFDKYSETVIKIV